MVVKKINSSSVAEIVIATAIISMCFTVASLIFIRATSSTLKFQNFKEQTAVQSKLMQMMVNEKVDLSDFELTTTDIDTGNDTIIAVEYTGIDNRVIWRQEWIKEK
jgi:hypothetical protein